MKSKTIIGIIAILAIIIGVIIISLSDKNGGWLRTPTPTKTATPTDTPSLTPTFTPPSKNTPSFTRTFTSTFTPTRTSTLTPTATFMVVCTPPACAIGTSEVYTCTSGTCPGGCGTTCATYTPTP